MIKIAVESIKNADSNLTSVYPIFKEDLKSDYFKKTGILNKNIEQKILDSFKGNLGENFYFFKENGQNLMIFGLGEKSKFQDNFNIYKSFGILGKTLATKNIKEFNLMLDNALLKIKKDIKKTLIQILKGLNTGFYKFENYLKDSKKNKTTKVNLIFENKNFLDKTKDIVNFSDILLKWTDYSRNHINEHSSKLNPEYFVNEISKTANSIGLKTKIFDENQLMKMGFGGILAVGKGSCHKPYLLVIENLPNKKQKPLALIGKSVTFDSGGISIKPQDSLDEMKCDMSGGSILASSVFLAKEMNIKKNLAAFLPIVENMPSHNAFKPGDILKLYGDSTVEVINTDAEGRIILADSIEYSKTYNPSGIVTLATLTGACIVALGNSASGLFTNKPQLKNKMTHAADISGERVWELPIYDEIRDLNKSHIAQIKNLHGNGKLAGTISAAAFLEYFVKNYPFLHLDIAGTAFYSSDTSWQKKGATGYGIELLYEFIKSV